MIRLFSRRLTERTIGVGTDAMIYAMSLPSGSVIHDINLELKMHQAAFRDIGDVVMYAVEGWILPVLDPDQSVAYDTLFDNLVPKDSDVESIDLDTGATDATPFFEPGEPDLTGLFDVGLQPERIYTASRMLDVNDALTIFQDNQTPFAIKYIVGDTKRIRIRKRYRVSQPSVLVFAVASPSLDDTSSSSPVMATEAEWGQTKYIGHVLERALLHVFGLTEAGAETPWEEATALLKLHLEPDVFEQNAGSFVGATWAAVCRGIVDHSVEGRLQDITVSTG